MHFNDKITSKKDIGIKCIEIENTMCQHTRQRGRIIEILDAR